MAETDKLFTPEFYETHPRVQLQAEDIGPIINYQATNIYRKASQAELPESLPLPESFKDLGHFADILITHAGDFIEGSPASEQAIQKVIVEQKNAEVQDVAFLPTFHQAIEDVIGEGIATGIVMPLVLLQDLECFDRYGKSGVNERRQILEEKLDLESVIERLRSRHFQAMLLLLSKTANGTYSYSSSIAETLTAQLSPLHRPVPIGQSSNMPFEKRGDRVVLTEAYKELIVAPMQRENTSSSRYEKHTMGCPVRLSAYPKLGAYARAFAEEMQIAEEDLMHPENSAIVAGCLYVADALEQLAYAA